MDLAFLLPCRIKIGDQDEVVAWLILVRIVICKAEIVVLTMSKMMTTHGVH